MYNKYARQTWVDVDLDQLRKNIDILGSLSAGATKLLVVKANAYGHGIVEIARCAETMGIAYLGVANVSEGLLLRENGIRAPILVMGYIAEEEVEYAVSSRLDHFVWLPEQLRSVSRLSARMGLVAQVHLKVDVGMGRLGAPPDQMLDLARLAGSLQNLEVVGLATHFPKADIVSDMETSVQVSKFAAVVDSLAHENLRPRLVHCANSPATLRFRNAHFDMVRLGIAAYGLQPDLDVPLLSGMGPILSWKARLGPPRTFEKGTPLSYGGEYSTSASETIAVAPLGYADGFRRYPKSVNTMLVDGQEASVVGRVCMDQCLVRLPAGSSGGSRVQATIIGQCGSRRITADDLAQRWGTNSYDVVCGIDVRVPRIYHQNQS